MNTFIHPTYSPSQLVRLELLQYENPEGLHPIEQEWRNLARELLEHVEKLQITVNSLNKLLSQYNRIDFAPFKFPQKFTSTNQQPSTID